MNEYSLDVRTDRSNKKYTVKFANSIKGTLIEDFINANWVNFSSSKDELSHITVTSLTNHCVVFLEFQDKIIACSCFYFSSENLNSSLIKIANISFTYVDEEYRRLGLSILLFEYVEKIAKINQAKKIKSFVHSSNIAQQKAAESQGRKIAWYIYEKELQ